jgi:hypothetical protein
MSTTVTANPAENGVAPGLAAVGFGTGSFTGTPDGAGFFSVVTNVDQVARFQVVAPEPGATLVGWGIDTTTLEDPIGSVSVGDFFTVLVDSDDNFVGVPYFDPEPVPPWWVTTGDIIDGADTYVVPWFTPYLRQGGFFFGDVVSGSATITLDAGITAPSGYWIEIIAFSGSGTYDVELTLGRVKTIWDIPEGGWQVGSVGFS